MKLWSILKSRFKKEKGEEWISERRAVCVSCSHNSLNSPERNLKQKLYKILSDFYTLITFAENEDLGECACGCSIYFKTRELAENCWAKEKYGDDKWKSIYIPNKKWQK
jgi:hypothetical protein